ncbi:MAG: hypothetical protein ABIG64_04380 [Candidatus Omnitrophota bacterium]
MNLNLMTQPKMNIYRPQILNLLLMRVEALLKKYRQNIAIVGYQSLGKTALIFDLLYKIKNFNLIPIYITLKTKSIELFAKNFMGILLYQYLAEEKEKVEDNLDFLINKSKEKIPRTAKEILKILKLINKKCTSDEIFSNVLDLPQILYEETQKPVILIFDEFQNFEKLGLNRPFLELSNKIMVQKNIMYIIISSRPYRARNILTKKLSLLFGNFEIVEINPFDAKTADDFISQELKDFLIEEDLKNFLIYLSGGYPFYLKIFLDQLKSISLEKNSGKINEEIFLKSLEELMHQNHGIINQYFYNKYRVLLNKSGSNLFPSILQAIADGKKKPSQIASYLAKKTPEVNRYINKLIEKDIITKKGIFTHINDPLFACWIKFVFSRDQDSFDMNIYGATKKFEDDLARILAEFKSESQKKISNRIKEVFELFENDIIELDKKRFMLTHFDEIITNDHNGLSLINARRLKKSWFCCVEKEFVDEVKVNEFIKKIKRKECLKRILIALDGIDVNARLKALEEKVWIWDQKILNELFSIFERPRFLK